MKCPKCNNEIANTLSVCPHCNNKIVKKNILSSKGAVNKYVKNGEEELVGGTVTKGKGTVAKIERKKTFARKPSNPHTNNGTKSKYLKEDNSDLVGGTTTKNKGSIFKLKSKSNVKKNYHNTQKGSKSKVLTVDESELVGGTVTKNSFVKLEKKNKIKNIKPVERKDFVNYIDYKEAKDEQEAKIHSLDDFKKSISFSEEDVSGKVVNSNKFKRSSKIENALNKSIYSDIDINQRIALDKNKPQPMQSSSQVQPKVDVSAPVEVKSVLPNSSNVQVVVQEPKKNKRSLKSEFNILSYVLVISLWIIAIVLLVSNSNNGFYFGQKQTYIATSKGEEYAEFEGVSKSGQTGGSSADGYTSIIYDNQYLGQFTIRTEEDVYNLIISDSLKQKGNCPPSIKKIEDEIINKYNITAVNLCEMNEDFAQELAYVVGYIYDEFPNARNYLTNLTLANVGEDNSFIAAFMPIFTFSTSNTSTGYPVATKTQIILNAKYFLNNEKIKNSVSYGTKSGYFPANATRSSTVAHEFGHYLSYIALLNYYETDKLNYVRANETSILYDVYDDFNSGNFSRILLEEAFDEYVAETGSTESFYEFRASISQYAIAKDSNGLYIYDETIAEAFHDYYLNGSNAKPASLAIMKVLKSKL